MAVFAIPFSGGNLYWPEDILRTAASKIKIFGHYLLSMIICVFSATDF